MFVSMQATTADRLPVAPADDAAAPGTGPSLQAPCARPPRSDPSGSGGASGLRARLASALLQGALVTPRYGVATVIAVSVPLLVVALLFSPDADAVGVIILAALLVALALVVGLSSRAAESGWLIAPLLTFSALVSLTPGVLKTNYLLLLLYWTVALAAYFMRPLRFLVVASATASLHVLSLWLFPTRGLSMLEWAVTMSVLAVPAILVWTLQGAVDRLDRLVVGLLESAAEPLVLVDDATTIVSANGLFSRLSGYSVAELEGRRLGLLVGDEQPPAAPTARGGLTLITTSAGERVPVSIRRAGEVGGTTRRQLRLLLVTDERERVEEALGREAALDAERAERQHLERISAILAREAEEDRLTGLLNRRGLVRRFAGLQAADGQAPSSWVVAVVLDLDDFKHLNDTYGHPAGDHVLQAVAARLADGTRDWDIVARHGGDEFVAILPEVLPARGAELVERLREGVAKPLIVTVDGEPREIDLRASAGLAAGLVGDVTLDDLIRAADKSLYHAKRAGGNRVGDQPSGSSHTAQRLRQAPVASIRSGRSG